MKNINSVPLNDFDLVRDNHGKIVSGTHIPSGRTFDGSEMKDIERERGRLLDSIGQGSYFPGGRH